MRNDSGCEVSSDDGALGPSWGEMVSDWSFKSHSIISQEMLRMQEATSQRQKEMETAATEEERDEVAERWREQVEGMMETAIDLIRCVGNDVVEASSSSESSLSTVSACDLGKIIEEELDGKKDETFFLVQTKAAGTKKKKRGKRRRAGGKVWESKKTFTIKVEEMHQVHDEADDDKCRGVAEWRKNHVDSPVVWNSGKDEGEKEQKRGHEEEEEEGAEEVEDIFRDWLRLQRRGSVGGGADAEDVNDIFWKIGMSDSGRTRQRRISEVLDNLPFDDHPDIFGDRCELLETAPTRAGAIDVPPPPLAKAGGKRVTEVRRLRRQKSYWNIFSEWKKIFNESHGRRQKRKRVFKHRRRSKRQRSGKVGQKDQSRLDVANNGSKLCKSPRKRSTVTADNYFGDFLHVFDEDEERRSRRRSRDKVDDDEWDEVFEENIPKRQRIDRPGGGSRYPYRRNWEVIRLESFRSFEMITRNIEMKIREAFREDAATSSREDSEFGRVKLEQSRQQFDSLRRRIQDMRQERRRSLEDYDEAVFFEEWRWNLQEPQTEMEIPAILKPSRSTLNGTAIRGVAQRYHFKGGTSSRQNATCLQRRPNARSNGKARFIHNFSMKQPRERKGNFGERKRA